jgi:cysteinyl-tRNA synthetase
MSLSFRNTLGGAVEPFEPIEPGHARMYSCGPTVYAPAHVGNFRSFVFADLVRRSLLFSGLRVTWVMNITDVDDKIIRDATAAGIPIGELTAAHTVTFLEDLARLGVPEPDVMPRATEHIEDMSCSSSP